MYKLSKVYYEHDIKELTDVNLGRYVCIKIVQKILQRFPKLANHLHSSISLLLHEGKDPYFFITLQVILLGFRALIECLWYIDGIGWRDGSHQE